MTNANIYVEKSSGHYHAEIGDKKITGTSLAVIFAQANRTYTPISSTSSNLPKIKTDGYEFPDDAECEYRALNEEETASARELKKLDLSDLEKTIAKTKEPDTSIRFNPTFPSLKRKPTIYDASGLVHH